MVENGFFYGSRAYVPLALYSMYRRGLFEEAFAFTEVRYLFKIVLVMQAIDIMGHFVFRYMTMPVVDRHVTLNKEAMLFKNKQVMEDYLVQKNYFNSKKN